MMINARYVARGVFLASDDRSVRIWPPGDADDSGQLSVALVRVNTENNDNDWCLGRTERVIYAPCCHQSQATASLSALE
ncbi:unnamed protein product [Echinostoma caproni]|uniref:WD_REPEATS_REGION domain-containing protein n=1 Tax=Echinostoma caproni TaxID=27848 RepID=A0A183A7I9_9TREM|nr:unnamed protein product [Echinostoma caproni]